MDLRRDERLGNQAWNWSSKGWIDGGETLGLGLGNDQGCRMVMRSSMNERLSASSIGSSSMFVCWCQARSVSQIE